MTELWSNTFLLLISILLVFLNGFFVAAEFAIVRLRTTQLASMTESNSWRTRLQRKIHEELDSYLTACQLGITLASIGLGWIGEPVVSELLRPMLNFAGIFSETTITIISFSVAYLIISFLHIVIGELVPKSIAIRAAEITAQWTAAPLYIFYLLFYPIIWVLNQCSNFILNLFNIQGRDALTTHYSVEELKMIFKAGHLHDELEKEEIDILTQVLEFTDLVASDLMRPAEEMVTLSLDKTLTENLNIITTHRFSRYPVYEEEPNNIRGILHIKDLLPELTLPQNDNLSLKILLRAPLIVDEDFPAMQVYSQFKEGAAHFALVKNSRDHIVGFITLDNVLIRLLGNIRDEFNKIKPDWLITDSGILLMKGSTPIYVLEKALGISIDTEAHTINGLIMAKLERLPKPEEKIQFPQFTMVVKKIKGPKVSLVNITKNPV